MQLATLASILTLLLQLSAAFAASPADRIPPSQLCENKKKSFLWRVRRKGLPHPPAYLFGTIHVPYTLVWDQLPHIAKHHFQQAGFVYFELDLTDPYTLTALSNCQLLPRGVRLNDTIPASLYNRLRSYLDGVKSIMPQWLAEADGHSDLADLDFEYGLRAFNRSGNQGGARANSNRFSKARRDYANFVFDTLTRGWEQKRPVWIMLMLQSLNENEIRNRGIPVLDVHLAQEALRRNQHTGAIERVEEQCSPLNRMSPSQVVFALNFTLSQLEYIMKRKDNADEAAVRAWRNPSAPLVRKYNCGNVRDLIASQQLSKQAVNGAYDADQLRRIDEVDNYFEEELLIKRNIKMAERVSRIIEVHPQTNFFFAFGAGHFVGKRSVVELLREAGYIVEHVGVDKLPDANGGGVGSGHGRSAAARRKRNQPPRKANSSVKLNRKRTTPTPNNIPIDPWSLSFVEPIEQKQQQRQQARPSSRPRQRQRSAMRTVGQQTQRSGNRRIRQRATDELLDYQSYWNNLFLLSGDSEVVETITATTTTATTTKRLAKPSRTPRVTGTSRTAQQRTTQVHVKPTASELIGLVNRVQQIRRRKLDESRVIDIDEDEQS